MLLTNPEDDKGDDYFLKSDPEGLKLIRIDNERAFFTPEASEGILKTQKLQVKSIVYCLDLLMEPIKTDNPNVNAAVRDFLQLKPYALLKSLLLELKVLQPLWQALFSEADIEAHYHNKRPWLSLPILYVPQEMVKELSVRMDSLQTLLALNPKTTGLQLLSTVQPKLAAHYLQGFKQYQNNQNAYSEVMARFDLSPGRQYKKQEQGLYSLHGTAAVTQSLRLSGELSLKVVKSIWQGKAYTADAILEQIEHWEADRSKKIYDDLRSPDPAVQKKAYVGWQQLSNRQRVLLFKNFSEGIRKNSISDIRLQQAILAALPNTTFHTLDLSAFHVSLEDKLLTSILKAGGGHLIELTLNGCQKLSDAIPGIIAENCPNLKVLNACNMGWKSFATGRNRRSPIQLSKVERLETQNCQALERFIVEASQAEINIQGCTALKHVQFSQDSSMTSAKQSEPGEFQYQLANTYFLGVGVSKNIAQTYYWARLSLEHKHPLSTMLCYALCNFYAVTPLNGSDESLAVEKAVVSLVGESVFISIQALKRAEMRTVEYLVLKEIKNSAAVITLLSLALAGNNAPQRLDLNRSHNVDAKGIIVLAEVLKTNDTLQHLNLSHMISKTIGDVGATALGAALTVNSTLRHLDLSSSSIGTKGAIALSEALKVNSTLQYLDLCYNPIGAAGTTALGQALLVNSTLQHLRLEGDHTIGAEGAVSLGQALLTNSTLKDLILMFTAIGDKGAASLGQALLVNSTLQDLNLYGNDIGPEGAASLGQALLTNSTLQHLELSGNKLDDNEGQKILAQIKECLNRNKQNAQKQPPAQKPLPNTKPLETKDDSPIVPLVAFQYEQQTLNARRLSIDLKQGEEFARTLQAELSNCPETPRSLSEQPQASSSNECSNTVPTTPVIPLVFPRGGNVSLNNQVRVVSTEEKPAFRSSKETA